MAAPLHKTIKDLNGKWGLNSELSQSADEALTLQGVSYFIRRGLSHAYVVSAISQYEAPSDAPSDAPDSTEETADGTETCVHIDINQNISSITSTMEKRRVDDQRYEHSDWVFGTVHGRTKWITLDEIDDSFLRSAWDTAKQSAAEEDKPVFLHGHVSSLTNGWTARHVWGFQSIQDERRFVRNVVVEKDTQRVECRLVYDFIP